MSLLGKIRIPAFVDLHVHFREPGFTYKETILSGSRAALRAGYSDVFTMPNLSPAPDTLEHLSLQTAIIARDSLIGVHPYASITLGQKGEGELVNIEELSGQVVGFSDDGRGIQDEGLMREAMQRIAAVYPFGGSFMDGLEPQLHPDRLDPVQAVEHLEHLRPQTVRPRSDGEGADIRMAERFAADDLDIADTGLGEPLADKRKIRP